MTPKPPLPLWLYFTLIIQGVFNFLVVWELAHV